MQTAKKLPSFSIIILSFMFVFLSASASHADDIPEGVYSGSVSVVDSNNNISNVAPLDISLSYQDQETTGDPNEIIGFKKTIVATFVLDHEGGPYAFSYASFDIETGQLDLRYTKPSSASTIPTLRFLGKIQKDGSFKGSVISGVSNQIGTFTLNQVDPTPKNLPTTPVYVGLFKGTVTKLENNQTDQVEISISPTSASRANPPDIELDFTPGKVGGLRFTADHQSYMSFDEIEVDYLRISIVGVGMRNHPGVAATFFRTLAKENIPVHLVTTSEIKVSAVIDQAHLEKAAQKLHTAFKLDQE